MVIILFLSTFNGSYVGNVLSVDANVSVDNDGKPNRTISRRDLLSMSLSMMNLT